MCVPPLHAVRHRLPQSLNLPPGLAENLPLCQLLIHLHGASGVVDWVWVARSELVRSSIGFRPGEEAGRVLSGIS